MLGVQVYLYSDDVPEVFCTQGAGSATPLSRPALCHAVSDAEGRFVFSGVPCGTYFWHILNWCSVSTLSVSLVFGIFLQTDQHSYKFGF